MTESNAIAVASALGGEAWHSGGGIWLVRMVKRTGRVILISDESICEYESESARADGKVFQEIMFP